MTAVGERRSRSRRSVSGGQGQLDTEALRIAIETQARQDGHEDVCEERYRNIDGKLDVMAGDIEKRHHENQGQMRRLEDKLDLLDKSHAVTVSHSAGTHWLGVEVRNWLVASIAVAGFIYSILHH